MKFRQKVLLCSIFVMAAILFVVVASGAEAKSASGVTVTTPTSNLTINASQNFTMTCTPTTTGPGGPNNAVIISQYCDSYACNGIVTNITVSDTDNGETIAFLSGGNGNPREGNVNNVQTNTAKGFNEGTVYIRCKVIDLDSGSCTGNGCVSSNTWNISVIDIFPPNLSIISPVVHANISGSFVVNASVNDTGTAVNLVNATIYNSTGNVTGQILMNLSIGRLKSGYFNATIDSTTLSDGRYNLSVNATDSASTPNTNITNVSITIDNTAANVSAVVPANNSAQAGVMLINGSANDTTSKVFNVTFRLTTSDGSTVTAWLYAKLNSGSIDQGYWNASFDTDSIADGTYNITINATDFAGNQDVKNISQIVIRNAPNNTVTSPAANSNSSGNLLINASVNATTGTISKVNVTLYNNTGNATGLIPMSLGALTSTSGYWNATIDTTTLRLN